MIVALRLRRHGVKRPFLVIAEAKRAELPLACAVALLEKETGIPQRNIFGCDHGAGRAFCHQRVTSDRVRQLLASGTANGVGWTQLTYLPFVRQAEAAGGAHKPKYQMRVGFQVLSDLITQHGVETGFARYNGSGPAAEAYGADALWKTHRWRRRIRRARAQNKETR